MRHVVDGVGEEGGYACNFMEAQVTGTTIESRMPFPINQLYNPTLALSLSLSLSLCPCPFSDSALLGPLDKVVIVTGISHCASKRLFLSMLLLFC
jgi:hypothetical protein